MDFTSFRTARLGIHIRDWLRVVSFRKSGRVAFDSFRSFGLAASECIYSFYLSFFRGIPALVLLFLLYFGLPYQLSALTASVICFTITSSAFIGEIYRGSLAGVSSGQWDAGLASGFSFFGVLKYIVLPQAFRISVPALSNVAMDLVKGTSLAATITVPEIFQKAKIIGGRTFDYFLSIF